MKRLSRFPMTPGRIKRGLALCLVLGTCVCAASAQSLYREDQWRSLTADNKAFRPGDVLTVQVYENSSAVSSADTDTRRNNQIQSELGHGPVKAGQANLAVAGSFEGGGRTQRASRLLATVTVTVREVLPNGQLRIGGTQSVTVNEEAQKVSVEGLVRPVDISDGNIVQSTRLADARITYEGDGDLSERNRRAWWRRVLDVVGL